MAKEQNDKRRVMKVSGSNIGKRVVVRPDNRVEIETFTPRPPNRGEVLLETVCTLISAGTELGLMDEPRTQDMYPGYSHVGRVIEVGEGVTDYAVGSLVASLGSHATHVTTPAAPPYLAPVPDNVTPEEASFTVLGSVALHGVRKAKVELGEYVAITGMGLVGQLTLQLVAQTGCEALIAVDLSDFRLSVAHQQGATHVLNPRAGDLSEQICKLTSGRGLDCIMEASGYPELLPLLFDLLRIGGRLLLLGSIWHRKVHIDLMPFHLKELTLISAHQPKCPVVETPYFPWTQQYNRRQILRMIGDGRLKVQPLITHRFPFTDIALAYQLLRQEGDRMLGVVLEFGTG